jgi:hypothetical protein
MIIIESEEHLSGIDGRGGHTEMHRKQIPAGTIVLKKAHAWEKRPTNKENQKDAKSQREQERWVTHLAM